MSEERKIEELEKKLSKTERKLRKTKAKLENEKRERMALRYALGRLPS